MIRIAKAPEGEELCPRFKVTAEGRDVPVHAARVSAMPINTVWPGEQRPLWQTEIAGFASLECDGPVTLRVEVADSCADAVVRPLSKGVECRREPGAEPGSAVYTFTLPSPGQYTFEPGDFHRALHVFADPLKVFGNGRAELRFGPGIHDVGKVELASHTRVVVEAGAIVRGCLFAYGAEDVVVEGYGIIDGSRETRPDTDSNVYYPCDYEAAIPWDRAGFDAALLRQSDGLGILSGCVRFYRCRNVRVEGVTMRDSAMFALIMGQCENAVVQNAKTIGMWRYNSDGFDLLNCRDVVIRDSFLRDFDDCIVIKGVTGLDEWNNERIAVERCVVWCDWGRALELGAETSAPEFRDIVFRDCDVIHGSAVMMDVHHHNRADIHDISFEDIRAEYNRHQLAEVYESNPFAAYVPPSPVPHPQLCAIPIWADGLFARDGKNGRAHRIAFRRIRVFADEAVPTPLCFFHGASDEHCVADVELEDFTLNGAPLIPRVEANEFVSNVTIDNGGGPVALVPQKERT